MENDILTIKLYTPLTAEYWPTDAAPGWEDEMEDETEERLNGYELLRYQSDIAQAIQHENSGDWDGNLMQYYHEDDAIKAKVESVVISAEPHENQLCGCATIQLNQPLEGEELHTLMEYITGQYSDGFGEGFEQREIKVDGGMLYVHLWQPDDFAFSHTAPAAVTPIRPAMKLLGEDGNIFAILGRASRLLRSAGQNKQAKEMTDRVCHSNDYNKALNIISEYVETELSTPGQPTSKPKSREDAR